MRRVPHPQPAPFNPPVYGREKLRSASFTTQSFPISLSSNDVKVKQTAEQCLLELLTNAGPEGMDIEHLARKVSVSVLKKFGCKSFAENVFFELIKIGPFRREGGRVFFVKKEEKSTAPVLPALPSMTQLKMEKLDKPVSPSISQERLKISRSADQSFQHETPSPGSKVRQPLAPAEYMLNKESQVTNYSGTKARIDGSVETNHDLQTTPNKFKDSRRDENKAENYPDIFTMRPARRSNTEPNSPGAKTITALKRLDPARLDTLLEMILQVIAHAAGNSYPIGDLLTEVTKASDFTPVEVVLAIANGPFTISELAQVSYTQEPNYDAATAQTYGYRTHI